MISNPYQRGISLYKLPSMLSEVFNLGESDTAVMLKHLRFAKGELSAKNSKMSKADSQLARKLRANSFSDRDLEQLIISFTGNTDFLGQSILEQMKPTRTNASAYDVLYPCLLGYQAALRKNAGVTPGWFFMWSRYLERLFEQEKAKLDEIDALDDRAKKDICSTQHLNSFVGIDLGVITPTEAQDFLLCSCVAMNLAAVAEIVFVSSIKELKLCKPLFSEFLPTVSTSKNKLSELDITNKKLMLWLLKLWAKSNSQSKKPKKREFYEFLTIKEHKKRKIPVDVIAPDTSTVKQRLIRWSKGNHYINLNDYHHMFYWARDVQTSSIDLTSALFVTVTNLFTLTQVKAREYGLKPEFVAEVYSNYPYFYDDVRNDFIAVMSEMD